MGVIHNGIDAYGENACGLAMREQHHIPRGIYIVAAAALLDTSDVGDTFNRLFFVR